LDFLVTANSIRHGRGADLFGTSFFEARLVTDKIRAIAGILSSQTLIAFRAYSQRDVTELFCVD
jgi:hypothetical protein